MVAFAKDLVVLEHDGSWINVPFILGNGFGPKAGIDAAPIKERIAEPVRQKMQ